MPIARPRLSYHRRFAATFDDLLATYDASPLGDSAAALEVWHEPEVRRRRKRDAGFADLNVIAGQITFTDLKYCDLEAGNRNASGAHSRGHSRRSNERKPRACGAMRCLRTGTEARCVRIVFDLFACRPKKGRPSLPRLLPVVDPRSGRNRRNPAYIRRAVQCQWREPPSDSHSASAARDSEASSGAAPNATGNYSNGRRPLRRNRFVNLSTCVPRSCAQRLRAVCNSRVDAYRDR